MPTNIPWANEVWNYITGCTKYSPGCHRCYAQRMAQRHRGRNGYPRGNPFAPGTLHPEKLELPLRWRKSRTVFVSSMGDLFHDEVPTSEVGKLLSVMEAASHHTYVLLTKRVHNMRRFFANRSVPNHMWVGVSVEDQSTALTRVPVLASIQARTRLVCSEPLLGPIDLERWLPRLSWVICGSETSPGARPMDLSWARSLRDQCVTAGVPFFLQNTLEGGRTNLTPSLDGKQWVQLP